MAVCFIEYWLAMAYNTYFSCLNKKEKIKWMKKL